MDIAIIRIKLRSFRRTLIFEKLRACSHQANLKAKAKKIKEQEKDQRISDKHHKFFTVTFAFAWCEHSLKL